MLNKIGIIYPQSFLEIMAADTFGVFIKKADVMFFILDRWTNSTKLAKSSISLFRLI